MLGVQTPAVQAGVPRPEELAQRVRQAREDEEVVVVAHVWRHVAGRCDGAEVHGHRSGLVGRPRAANLSLGTVLRAPGASTALAVDLVELLRDGYGLLQGGHPHDAEVSLKAIRQAPLVGEELVGFGEVGEEERQTPELFV